MFVSHGATPAVNNICRSVLNSDLATFLKLVVCFTLVFEGQWYKEDFKVEYRVEPFDRAVWTLLRGHLPGFSCNCRTIHHILPDKASHKELDTGVSHLKQGGGVIDATCQSSIRIVVWNQCSLSFHSSSDAHTTSGSRHRCSNITLTVLVTLACSFVLRSSPRFSRKRETARSLLLAKRIMI